MSTENNLPDETTIQPMGAEASNAQPTAAKRTFTFRKLNKREKALLQASAAGVSGIPLGAIVMLLMGAKLPENEAAIQEEPEIVEEDCIEEEDASSTPPEVIEVPIYQDAPFSDAVNNNMSFNEAFAAARKDVGPGGFFNYKGETYNTYYKEEWDSLSPADKQDYYASLDTVTDEHAVVTEEEILDILNDQGEIVDEITSLDDQEDIVLIGDEDNYAEVVITEDVVILDEDSPTIETEDTDSFADGFEDIDFNDLG